MAIERARGISITSAALQFEYRDAVINLLDTPGHADFSEDTYRVLTAVDSAVMLLDAAKGLERQTMMLFEVCRRRHIPLVTFINKWDRPGLDALALCDEIADRLGLQPMPLTWPVGEAADYVACSIWPTIRTPQPITRKRGRGTRRIVSPPRVASSTSPGISLEGRRPSSLVPRH